MLREDETRAGLHLSRSLLKRVWNYAQPYVGYILFVLLSIMLVSLLDLLPPLLFRELIDTIIPQRDYQKLNFLAIGLIGLPLLSGLVSVAGRYFSARAGEGIIFDLRQQMYTHLLRMSIRFFTNTKSGEIISRFNNDVVGAQGAITSTLPNIITNLVTLVSTLLVMLTIEWRLALFSVAVLPLFLLPARRVARILREIRRRSLEYNAEMSNIINETLGINGALLVKTFGSQRREAERFRGINAHTRDIGVRQALIGRWFFLGMGLSGAIGTALIYWIGGRLVLDGAITVGTIVAFAAYLARLYGPISGLTNVQVEFASSMVSFERVFEYLDLPVEIQERHNAFAQFYSPARRQILGQVRFENVSFSYSERPRTNSNGKGQAQVDSEYLEEKANLPGIGVYPLRNEVVRPGNGNRPELDAELSSSKTAVRWALKDLSFEINPGQLVALVGHSGAGKTTVTYLLPRLYDPTSGRITLDGIDLRDLPLEILSQSIGMVTQETYLFHDTVRNNLLYARPEASLSEIEDACRAANIHDYIQTLPQGYDTIVGERGYRLSGGEKQRLAIARVILKNPRLLILDEATSHLDSHNETLIQSALEPLFAGRTSLVIAHRLSTILKADRILVLDQGTLVEQGTHAELLAHEGLYAQLYEFQFKDK